MDSNDFETDNPEKEVIQWRKKAEKWDNWDGNHLGLVDEIKYLKERNQYLLKICGADVDKLEAENKQLKEEVNDLMKEHTENLYNKQKLEHSRALLDKIKK